MSREEATMAKQTGEVKETTKQYLHHRLRSHSDSDFVIGLQLRAPS